MARRIIILDQTDAQTWRWAMWADVPAARQSFYANASATSAVKDATAGELSSIQTGAIAERVGQSAFPGMTVTNVQTALIAAFNAFQAEITNANLWSRYGTSWDGTTWTPKAVS